MNRRRFLKLSALTAGSAASLPLLTACGAGQEVSENNRYRQTNLVANSAVYKPLILEPGMVDAWGIAIRPAGAGGHFWVTASGVSYEYVGDVNGTPLFQDGLKEVALPASGENVGAANGIVFNGSSNFVITQDHPNGAITGPSKFIFVSDNGVLSAWTERKNADGSFDRSPTALSMIDEGAANTAFFGLAISPSEDKLYALDFGNNPSPRIRIFNSTFTEEPAAGRFVNPFLTAGATFKPGDYAPFNIQTVKVNGGSSVFIAYVNTQEDPDNPGQVLLATESAGRGRGRLVEYTADGQLVTIWNDRGTLNGPWGIVVAPANFGPFSNQLLVGNFSDGTIVGFDTQTKAATEFLRDEQGFVKVVPGIWALLFGNGQSLGDSNAMYFGAGPADETDGVFGSLRFAG